MVGALVAAFAEIAPGATPVFASAHRWRFAQVETAAEQGAFWNPKTGIGVCGDWCVAARVEAAWTSGRTVAQMMTAPI